VTATPSFWASLKWIIELPKDNRSHPSLFASLPQSWMCTKSQIEECHFSERSHRRNQCWLID
jgi:hypothetical protein